MSVYVAIPVMLLLLLLKGMFSGSEIALVSADKIRLKRMAKSGHKGARLVLKAFERPDELLSNTLIGTNISTIALTTIGTLTMVDLVGAEGDLWAFVLFTPIFLILGEIVPKSVFQDKADMLTPILIYPLVGLSKILRPIIFVFSRVASFAARLAGGGQNDGLFVSREQLSEVVKLAESSGSLGELNQGQLRRILSFCDTPVSKVMIPLKDVLSFVSSASTRELVHQALATDHRRFPVYTGEPSNITGVAVITNWAMLDPAICNQPLETLIRPVIYVNQSQSLDEVLPLVRKSSERMAIVVDDAQVAVGVVSFEDVLQSAIGNINLGHDITSKRHLRLDTVVNDDGSFVVDGHMPIIKLNQLLNQNLFSGESGTVHDMLVESSVGLPEAGDVIAIQGYEFSIEQVHEGVVSRVMLCKP